MEKTGGGGMRKVMGKGIGMAIEIGVRIDIQTRLKHNDILSPWISTL